MAEQVSTRAESTAARTVEVVPEDLEDRMAERVTIRAEATATRTVENQNKRNATRLTKANERDLSIIGESDEQTAKRQRERRKRRQEGPKEESETAGDINSHSTHMETRPEAYFHSAVRGPDDSFSTPSWFLMALTTIARTATTTPKRSPIVFENNESAAAKNEAELKSVGFSVDRLISKYADTTLGYGSEFRTVEQLRPLIGRHPHFEKLAQVLTSGMSYVFKRELDPATKSAELQNLLARGNHKSATDFPLEVGTLLEKDVSHGFVIPIPISAVSSIPGAAVQPLGLAQQWTLDEEGRRKTKFRLTQDLSFSSSKDGPSRSINDRIDMSAYVEMVYGWCLSRILHYIVAVRLAFPLLIIFISKYDYSDAYRRIAHSASAATQTFAAHGVLAYLALRLTFGGSPNPPTWCMFSEIVTDLANEISQCREWDPAEVHSPMQPVAPPPRRLGSDVPIRPGKAMAVEIPVDTAGSMGRVDGFIDDLINVFLDTPENCKRQPHVVPLAMHVTSRPHAGDSNEPITRRNLLSIPKLLAEGSPDEVQIVLGWRIDTRRMLVALPDDKYHAWMADIDQIIANQGRCKYEDLDQLAGRLNHSSFVMPASRHFLGRIRSPLTPRRSKRQPVRLSQEAVNDLRLWRTILTSANVGISINLLVTREPTRICWSDACPLGMGGYGLSGRAWRLRLPVGHPLRGHPGVNNLLEFTAMVVNVWLECRDPSNDQECILAVGDSTSAIGWLFKSSGFEPDGGIHDAHLMVARHLASLLTKHNCCLASQHIRGELNVVADFLSFAGSNERGKKHPLAPDDPPNDVLTLRFRKHLTSQVPENFLISQLPEEILSWVTLVLQTATLSLEAAKKGATRERTASGDVGKVSVATPATPLTPSSLCYPSSSAKSSQKPSFIVTEPQIGPPPGTLQESVRSRWFQALSVKPQQATWLRRFGVISGRAPCTSREVPTCSPSSVPCSRRSTTPTPLNGSNEQ